MVPIEDVHTWLRWCRSMSGTTGAAVRGAGVSDRQMARWPIGVCDELQEFVLRSKPISFRNSIAIAWSLNNVHKNSLFGPPSALTIWRPWGNLGTFCTLRMRSSYFETTSKICATMVIPELLNVTRRNAPTLLFRSKYATSLISRSSGQQDACWIVVACWVLATCIMGVSCKTRWHA